MSNAPGGISQSNSGSMAGGMQASIGSYNEQVMNTDVTAANRIPTQQEVVRLLAELEQLVQVKSLPEADKERVMKYLGAAKTEVEAEKEPDKGLVAKNLERATKTLKAADEAIGVGTSIFEKVAPIVKAIAPWIGTAAGALLAAL